jgi:hypothetical protein
MKKTVGKKIESAPRAQLGNRTLAKVTGGAAVKTYAPGGVMDEDNWSVR